VLDASAQRREQHGDNQRRRRNDGGFPRHGAEGGGEARLIANRRGPAQPSPAIGDRPRDQPVRSYRR
jgi:hypothetical protein